MRKKIQYNPDQLSLFDPSGKESQPGQQETILGNEFKKAISSIDKKLENGTEISKNDRREREPFSGGGKREHDFQERTILEGPSNLRNATDPASRKIPGNEKEENSPTLSQPDLWAVLPSDGEMPGRRNGHARSRGTELENINRTGRSLKEGKAPASLTNFHITEEPVENKSFNKKARLQDNLNALSTLYTLQTEKRLPNETEKSRLAKYVGWGGIKQILLNPEKEEDWTVAGDLELRPLISEVHKMISLLDPDGEKELLLAAQKSILNAHYTSYGVIKAIFKGLQKAGFRQGQILEPAAGIGNFFAAMPVDMADNSEVTGIEKDPLSGLILQKLYPTALTITNGYEEVNLPEDSQDLILSNVPFGDTRIYDKRLNKNPDSRYAKAANNLHNYFFAKSITMAKPGGLINFITSRYTLDAQTNQEIRDLIDSTCRFLGAIRLPDNAFSANAGTSVVSDIIFLQKRPIGEKIKNPSFKEVLGKPFSDKNGVSGIIRYNEYFHNNPENMLGRVAFGGLYRKDEFNLKGFSGQNPERLEEQIESVTERLFPEPVYRQTRSQERVIETGLDKAYYVLPREFDEIGNIIVLNGQIPAVITDKYHIDDHLDETARQLDISPYLLRQPEEKIPYQVRETLSGAGINLNDFRYRIAERLRVSQKNIKRLAFIQGLRQKTKELLNKEANGYDDNTLSTLRGALRTDYFSFIKRYGNLHSKENQKLIKQDSDRFVIGSLEKTDPANGKISPADILYERTLFPKKEIKRTDDIREAVAISLQKFGRINTNYVAELMDKPFNTLMDKNNRSERPYIFINEDGRFLPREEYLSGNVLSKLKVAEERVKTNSNMEVNVRELKKNLPKTIEASEIYAPLHARWIPAKIVEQFLKFNLHPDNFDLAYSKANDSYNYSSSDYNSVLEAYGTKRRPGRWTLNHALNGIEPKVNYTMEDEWGNKKTVFDPEDTQLAKSNYNKIRNEWDSWKYQDYDRRKTLESIYNKKFNNIVLRGYDGSGLTLPGMTGYTLRPHQKDCVFRNIQQFGGINDHMVGAGKTLIQVATAMELRRLGLANKPMIIGLKSQIPQLFEQFKKAYPLAKVLYPTEKDFRKANRKKLLTGIATNDWDCIIISHDQFNLVPQPPDTQIKLVEQLKSVIEEEMDSTSDKRQKKSLIKRLENYETKIDKLLDLKKDTEIMDFSKIGVDFLMVDESQEFKNLEFITSKNNIKGLGNPVGSKKAFNLLVACRYLQEFHKGDKGILFSSGTPISNTMAELYLLFKYLRPSKLKEQGLDSFDKWTGVFANDYSDLEYYMGKFKEVHRFREFVNLPELLKTYREIADVRNDINLILPKPKADHHLIKLEPSTRQTTLIEKLQQFIDTKGNENAAELGLTSGYDEKKGVNPSYALLAINFAKKLSLDPRLISPTFPRGTKLPTAAENIFKIYKETTPFRGTQLVFSDIGTPKKANTIDNFYDYLAHEIPTGDLNGIFGENYYEKAQKPKLEDIIDKTSGVLHITAEETQSLIREANIKSIFNVYQALKNILIEKGVPGAEIAFIHDYNTSKQKEELYRKTNKGAIRILLGSTKKLGTGVNVQERVVAGHHLDISWRPSDIDQRNGRFIRQGNSVAKKYLNNIVPAYYYATERTLDASMYNTVSQKAAFISQIKAAADIKTRSVKDFEEEIDISSMAAELSGNPIFKERAKLTKSINQLELLEKAFNSRKFSTENKIKDTEEALKTLKERITLLEKNISYVRKIPMDKNKEPIFLAQFKDQKFDKIGQYGSAITGEIEHAKKYKSVGSKILLGQVWGFSILGTLKENFMSGEKEVTRTILSPSGDLISQGKPLSTAKVSAGIQIRQAILYIPKELVKCYDLMDEKGKNILQYRKQLAEGFPNGKELSDYKNRMTEINEEIKKLTKVDPDQKSDFKEKNNNEEQSCNSSPIADETNNPSQKWNFHIPRI